jgi:hypothetical protein
MNFRFDAANPPWDGETARVRDPHKGGTWANCVYHGFERTQYGTFLQMTTIEGGFFHAVPENVRFPPDPWANSRSARGGCGHTQKKL